MDEAVQLQDRTGRIVIRRIDIERSIGHKDDFADRRARIFPHRIDLVLKIPELDRVVRQPGRRACGTELAGVERGTAGGSGPCPAARNRSPCRVPAPDRLSGGVRDLAVRLLPDHGRAVEHRVIFRVRFELLEPAPFGSRSRIVVGDAAVREVVVAVPLIHGGGLPDRLEVPETLRALRPVPRLVQRRQQHGGKNRNDRDHNQQLNESERFSFHLAVPFFTVEALCLEGK